MSTSLANKLVAIASTVAYFTILPKLIKDYIWPSEIALDRSLFLFVYLFILHQILWYSVNFVYFIFYKFEFKFIEQFRINEEDWPWKTNKKEFMTLLIRSSKIILSNQLIVVPIMLYINIYVTNSTKLRIDMESFPTILELIWQIALCAVLDDFGFYWSHRLLHWKAIYPYFHKVHHEYKYTISISSEHAHFVEFIFGNMIPSNLGVVLLGSKCHAVTMGLWLTMKIIKTSEGHSGYHFPCSPFNYSPFIVLASEFHNFHHLKFKSNYGGFFTFWDRVCGTVHPSYRDFVDKKKYE